MNFRSIINAAARLWTASMVLFCVSCSEEMDLQQDAGKDRNEAASITLKIAVAHPDAGLPTRAQTTYDDLTFTQDEAAVKNLVTFIVNVDDEGKELYGYDDVEYIVTEINPIEFYKGIYILEHKLEVKPGKKHIYIGANMKDEHMNAFILDRPLALEGEGPAVNMIMTPDPTYSGKGTDILMFGQIKKAEGNSTTPDIIIDENIKEYYLQGDLERLTAKVLLTCREGETGLVATGGKGWLKTSDVRYTLNATNRKTFVNKHTDENYDVNLDPNWGLKEWVIGDGNGNFTSKGTHLNEFEYWPAEDMMLRFSDIRYYSNALKYDSNRLKGNNGIPDNHYVEGIYCLENTGYNDMGLTDADIDNAARIATTHVVIAVRWFPRGVYGKWSDNIVAITSSDDAWTRVLTPGAGTGTYPAGTYWTLNNNGTIEYYGYGGMERKISNSGGALTTNNFTCYEGGWSYFTTFVDGDLDDSKLTYAGHESWGVQRDNYYILAIQSITQPGSPFPDNTDYIKVNSITTDWIYRGSQEVSISPTGGK
ncbi:MAG: Mfa1 family fimbria major subunit [Bacteroidales bacterium]|nr:Mfa1 family fimbria major subunit [Bacteroidales bacterium]